MLTCQKTRPFLAAIPPSFEKGRLPRRFYREDMRFEQQNFVTKDRVPPNKPGFWERNGYHMNGDPWKEQRFAWD